MNRHLLLLVIFVSLPAAADNNRLPNSHFDGSLAGWTTAVGTTYSADANGSASSGSLSGINTASSAAVMSEAARTPCMPAPVVVSWGGSILIPAQATTGSATLLIEWFSDVNCATPKVGTYGSGNTTAVGAWTANAARRFTKPGSAVAMSIVLSITKDQAGGSFTASFDDVWLTASPRSDVSGDGRSDVVWRNVSSGDQVIWYLNGANLAATAPLPSVDPSWKIVALGDFQGDGIADFLWRNISTGAVVVWLMNGATVAASGVLPTVADLNWQIVAVGDFQKDGKSDVVWRNSQTGNNSIWLMNGLTVAVSAALPAVPDTNWTIAGAGDFQGDGKTDLFWRHTQSGNTSMWLMDGANVAVSAAVAPVPDFTVAAIGDLQGDLKDDIIWRNKSGATVAWLMNGPIIAVSAVLPTVNSDWSIARAGDFQADGKADLFWRNSVTGGNVQWLMNGTNVAATTVFPNVAAGSGWNIVTDTSSFLPPLN